MRTPKFIPNYTVSDYNLWEGNWELIDGVPCAMSPSPVRRHQHFLSILSNQISNELNNDISASGDCIVVSDLDWIVNERTVLRPDLALICDAKDDFITKPPVLIAEILSPSTALNDRHVKFEIYQEQGVKYYIIANPATRTCQSYVLSGKEYIEKGFTSLEIHTGCTIAIDLDKAMSAVKD